MPSFQLSVISYQWYVVRSMRVWGVVFFLRDSPLSPLSPLSPYSLLPKKKDGWVRRTILTRLVN
ncbi:hypothetical protein [Chroococcidiopsis thermalis]|uniref:hypothetical protein n=1 Tax=Chroococcidiopsis thermalis TaxID=54299 RepID=UPI0011B1CE11|nr:hypothetical protein [Chroococcidiopsis thermalis]